MLNGFIIFHRKTINWEWYKDAVVSRVFFHLLLKANHQNKKWQNKEILRGQLITGRKVFALELGITEQNVRTAWNKLKSTNEITIKSTNKYSLITILKYDLYQGKVTSKSPANQPTINQQLTTNNNDNNVNNINNIYKNIKINDGPSTDGISKDIELKQNNVNYIIGLFEKVNPSYKRLYANKTQRSAIDRMIKEHGTSSLESIIQKLPSIVTQPYAPKITTPLQLEKDFGKLILYIKQNQNSNNLKRGGVYVIE